jgi:hypothetical protein
MQRLSHVRTFAATGMCPFENPASAVGCERGGVVGKSALLHLQHDSADCAGGSSVGNWFRDRAEGVGIAQSFLGSASIIEQRQDTASSASTYP